MASLITWLPHCLRLCLGRRGLLPRVVVLKERNPGRPERHSCELEVYDQLMSLQGGCIPLLYGEAMVYDGLELVPALLIEYVEGSILTELLPEYLASSEARHALQNGEDPRDNGLSDYDIVSPKLLAALRATYDELTTKGLVHGDPKSDNFMATISSNGEYKVRAIDLEYTHLPDATTNHTDFNSIVYELADFIAPEKIVDEEPPQRRS